MPHAPERARFVRRENRFVACVLRSNGDEVRAYVPNTARLHEVLRPGAEVVLSPGAAAHRTTDWTLTRVWDGTWVSLEASAAATLLVDHLTSGGALPGWPAAVAVRREVTRGAHRFDLELALPGGERGLVEVKSLSRAHHRHAPLSGTPSARGTAQLSTLARLAAAGHRVAVVLVVQRGDVDLLDLTAEADPDWRAAITSARTAGVHCIAYRCEVDPVSARLERSLPIRDRPPGDLAAVYLDSCIDLELTGGTATIRARAAHAGPGQLPGELEAAATRLHVLTACNPYSAPLPDRINADRNRLLATALADRGYRWIPAHGRAPDGHWREPGFGVLDGDVNDLIALARRFEQHAVYDLTRTELTLRWTDPTRPDDRRGWGFTTRPTRSSGP